jgi:hypothetical protein
MAGIAVILALYKSLSFQANFGSVLKEFFAACVSCIAKQCIGPATILNQDEKMFDNSMNLPIFVKDHHFLGEHPMLYNHIATSLQQLAEHTPSRSHPLTAQNF